MAVFVDMLVFIGGLIIGGAAVRYFLHERLRARDARVQELSNSFHTAQNETAALRVELKNEFERRAAEVTQLKQVQAELTTRLQAERTAAEHLPLTPWTKIEELQK